MDWSTIAVCALACASFFLLWYQSDVRARALLPPGPKGHVLIGNLLNMTTKDLWLRVTSWAETYGDFTYISVFGQGILYVHTYEASVELLEKRGAIYSDKPRMVMCGELCGCENLAAFMRYGDKFRRQRRLLLQALGTNAVTSYQPLLAAETYTLLHRIAQLPDEYVAHIRRYTSSVGLAFLYGYRAVSDDDRFLHQGEAMIHCLANDVTSGGGIWPVDVFPLMQHIPDWMPGAGFKRKAASWKAQFERCVDQPYQWAKQQLMNGTLEACFCKTLMNDKLDPEREEDIRYTANSIYIANIDTTFSGVSIFIYAMLQNPAVVIKAQRELDAVLGPDRLPTPADRAALPYVNAVLTECLRWAAPVPLGLGRRLTQDDVYTPASTESGSESMGPSSAWRIPAGTIVFPNLWKMSRDPALYPDPEAFVPERYLDSEQGEGEGADEETRKRRDPRRMLATFDFRKAVDDAGKVVEPELVIENAIFRIPAAFPCELRLRSRKTAELIAEAYARTNESKV